MVLGHTVLFSASDHKWLALKMSKKITGNQKEPVDRHLGDMKPLVLAWGAENLLLLVKVLDSSSEGIYWSSER